MSTQTAPRKADETVGDALKAGEDPRRLLALPVWRETPFFTAMNMWNAVGASTHMWALEPLANAS